MTVWHLQHDHAGDDVLEVLLGSRDTDGGSDPTGMMVRRAGQLDYGVVDTGWATESHRIKGTNRQISGLRCRWHRLFSCIGFAKLKLRN